MYINESVVEKKTECVFYFGANGKRIWDYPFAFDF